MSDNPTTDVNQAARSIREVGQTADYFDEWSRKDAKVKLNGRCVVCSRKVYELSEDGRHFYDPDPRGPLGETKSCACLVAKEYDATGPDVPMCFDCANTGETYRRGLAIARGRWTR